MELIKNFKETSIIKNLIIAICGTILLAVSAKVKIPFYPVPMTMQTFVVLLLGVSLGWKLGLFTVSLYLIQGIAGLPVFAGTPEKGAGIVYFTFSVSFIYLLGMIWLGILIGWDKPVFKLGAQPFLLAELFKVVLLALIIPALFKFKKS